MRRIRKERGLCKRGGSSGGGGGSSSSQTTQNAPPQKSLFGVANQTETASGIKTWEDEFDEMTDARQGMTNRYSGVNPGLLEDSAWIAQTVANVASEYPDKVIGIKDSKGNIQAGAIYEKKKDHVYIGYLATAPWNFTNDSRAMKGAGTKAIIEAVKLDRKQGGTGEVRLFGLDGALPYYTKLGFKPYKPGSKNNLKLSAEDADKLLKKYGEA